MNYFHPAPPVIVDLFSGAGGLSLGLEWAGFRVALAVDSDTDACLTFSRNHPQVKVIQRDIRTVSATEVQSALGGRTIDVVCAGPPCQGFSTAGKRAAGDPRNMLFQEVCRLVKALAPTYFLFENVPGLVIMSEGKLLQIMLQAFSNLGYRVYWKVLLAADYGVPQLRKRLIIVGARGRAFVFPQPTHRKDSTFAQASLHGSMAIRPWVTAGDAISDLPALFGRLQAEAYEAAPQTEYQDWARQGSSQLHNHEIRHPAQRDVERIRHVPEGSFLRDLGRKGLRNSALPSHLRLSSQAALVQKYRRISRRQPSQTVLTVWGSMRIAAHYDQDRPLTPREMARLQSFPDKYEFLGSLQSQYRQVAEAVPPIFTKALAAQLAKGLADKHNIP